MCEILLSPLSGDCGLVVGLVSGWAASVGFIERYMVLLAA